MKLTKKMIKDFYNGRLENEILIKIDFTKTQKGYEDIISNMKEEMRELKLNELGV